jgi:CDP-4-dehydro-6-deoxyglucose reductase
MPRILNGILSKKENLTGSYWLFCLEFQSPYDFLAGQYVSIKVAPDGTRRSYSIASPPDGKTIELLIDVSPGGVGSQYFLSLNEGDTVEALGPVGIFTLATKNPKPNRMFIATGSGIAPLRAMTLDSLRKKTALGEVRLLWGMRHEEDLFWQEEFVQLSRDYANFSYQVVLSKPSEDWHGESGHVEDCLGKGFMIQERDLKSWEFFLCGGQEMIMETGGYLASQGVTKENIHFEKFF